MSKVMVDIETLGTSDNSVVLSVGAVKFDHNFEVIATYERTLPATYQHESLGRVVAMSTLKWWFDQTVLNGNVPPIDQNDQGAEWDTLSEFARTYHDFLADPTVTEVWANSPDFDIDMLDSLCKDIAAAGGRKYTSPVPFFRRRDFRTAVSIYRARCMDNGVVMTPRPEPAHSALEDAMAQMRYLQVCMS